MEQLPKLDVPTGRIIAIFTDSKVTTDSLKNHSKHSFLIEEIRNKVRHLSTLNWSIHFGWVKAHMGIEGNEAADKIAKEAVHDEDDYNIVYDRIPSTTVATEINMKGLKKWQNQWNGTENGTLCWSFFPSVEEILIMKICITPEFTAIVTGHGKKKHYLHRFKIADNPTCPCNEGAQTSEHIWLQNFGAAEKFPDTAHNGQRRRLATHQRWTGSQLFKCIYKIHQINRLSKIELDYPCTRPGRNSSSWDNNSDIFRTNFIVEQCIVQ